MLYIPRHTVRRATACNSNKVRPGSSLPTPRAFCRVDNRFRRTPERPISGTFGIHGFLRWLVFPGACGGCCGGEGAEGARRPSPLATRRGRVTRVSPGCVTAVSLRKIPDLHRRSSRSITTGPKPPTTADFHSISPFSHQVLEPLADFHHDPYQYLGNSASAVAVWMPPRPRHGSGKTCPSRCYRSWLCQSCHFNNRNHQAVGLARSRIEKTRLGSGNTSSAITAGEAPRGGTSQGARGVVRRAGARDV